MLDNITIDQLRVFIAAAQQVLSAAGRKLHSPICISHSISTLKKVWGFRFDRSRQPPN